jgi:hypothetical protein
MGGFAVAVVCALACPVRAGEGDKAAARAHYETGTRLYEVREYADALREYKAAYVAKPDPAFLFNIGQCYRKMKRSGEALDSFRQFLKKADPEDPNRAMVEARIRNIESGLIPKNDPFDDMDGAKPLPPSTQAKQDLAIQPDPLSAQTRPLTTAPALPSEREGQRQSTEPPLASQPAAPSTIQVQRSPADLASTPSLPYRDSGRGSEGWWLGRKWTWVATGVAAVFTVGAVSAGIAMQSKFDSLNSSCGSTSVKQQGCTRSDYDALDARRGAANVMWGLAGAAVVTAGVLFYLEGRSVTVAPLAGTTAGLVASVRY